MSAATARAVPLRLPDTRTAPSPRVLPNPRGLLRLVPQRRSQAARTPFAVVLVVLLVGGLLGLLLLNTLVAQDSFTLHDLAKQSKALQLREQQLAAQVESRQAPGQLAERAIRLGMVPGGPPAFLRLPDGHVLGQPTKGRPVITPVVPSPAPASTSAAQPVKRTPRSSTTWTAPRSTPPPSTAGAQR
ncbi:MAG TPA: hypothetical protein VM097_01605 [Mycobacteriales bacterium]|nr:hypothetical protein [Mycobacteriales bacterium]